MKKNKETRLWRRKFEMPLGMTGSFGTKGNSMEKLEKQRKNHKDTEKKNKKRNSSDDGSVPYGMGIRVLQLFMLAAFSTGGSHRSGSLNG